MNTYASPHQIGLGDSVNYNFKNYLVLINYIKGETDAKGYTPESNRTILIDVTLSATLNPPNNDSVSNFSSSYCI